MAPAWSGSIRTADSGPDPLPATVAGADLVRQLLDVAEVDALAGLALDQLGTVPLASVIAGSA